MCSVVSGYVPRRLRDAGDSVQGGYGRRGEATAQAAAHAQGEARVLDDRLVDGDVAVPGEDREHCRHLGQREMLADAPARAEPERQERARCSFASVS